MAAEPLAQRAAPERPLRVLVVDANTTARNHVQLSLGEGYAVDCVSTLDEAITELHRMRPDLIVSEVDLPAADGFALCEYVRALPGGASLPIMLLTGRAQLQDKVAGFQAGADDYVVKPLDPRLFFARVRLLCKIKSLAHPFGLEA
ncbi:MAG TPA: response regulator [Ktedonobacterales bacterium]|jgi:DNA-binding response OmpR family regulator